MHFMLDENVPADVAEALRARGHTVAWIRDYIPPGSPDPLVATVSQELEAVLISFDGDFQKIAPRIPYGQRTRFRRLSRIWMRCKEPEAARRIESALALIDSEYAIAQDARTRLLMWIGSSFIRIDR